MLNQTDRWLQRTLLATAIALGVPSIALAQEEPTPEAPAQPEGSQEIPAAQPAAQPVPAQQPPSAPPPPAETTDPDTDTFIPTDAESEEVFSGGEEVIVVTGSIIERRELTTPAPLAVLDKADLDAAGVASIGQILQNLPSQSNAINVQFNNGGDGSTRVSLRGLGAGRTLVLVNGRRHVAGGTGADASVDLNAIPTAVIERVEVLKDGASAVYGSDAIGGVVNIITRSNFEGSEASVYTGITGDGHGQVLDISAVTGINSDRGNVVFAVGYTDQQPILAGVRDYSSTDKIYNWATGAVTDGGSQTTPQGYFSPANRPNAAEGNELWQSVYTAAGEPAALTKDPASGSDPTMGWRAFDGSANAEAGGDLYNYQPENYLLTPQKRYSVFSTGSYKLHDYARAFFEATYTNRKSDQRLAPEPINTLTEGIIVSADNWYNPFERDFILIRRRMVEGGPRRSIQDIDTFRVVTGLDGRLPDELPALQGWRWSLAYNYGRTDSKQIAEGNFIRNRVANALGPSFMGADGTPQCGTAEAPIPGCVPLNFFGGFSGGEGTITPEMLDYIGFVGTDSGFNQQQLTSLNITGKLFEIPGGGDAALALGAEYRSESGADIPNPLVAAGEATGNKRDATEGAYDVREGFAELSVVPLVGKTGAEWVELNAALRAFDYNTFGSDFTWKAGGLWKFGQGVAVRGTYSTAFRAPPISSLYSGQTDGFPSVTDPCDSTPYDDPDDPNDVPMNDQTENEIRNCAAQGLAGHRDSNTQQLARTGGNPDLGPETAKIFTTGAVYEPTFAPGLSFTLDYFNIQIDEAISTLGADLILQSCYDADPGENKYCDLITRDPSTNLISRIQDTLINVGGNDTAGVDLNVRYNQSTDVGSFMFNLEGTWLHKFNSIEPDGTVIEGRGVYDLGVYPRWRANFGTMWGMEEWGAGANLRYVGRFRECEDDDCKLGTKPDGTSRRPEDTDDRPITREVGAHVTADLYGSYTLDSPLGNSRLTLGVNNVVNARPATIYNGFLGTSDASTYDFLGRYFYARFVQQF